VASKTIFTNLHVIRVGMQILGALSLSTKATKLDRARMFATFTAIGNLLYVSPNYSTIANVDTDNWYQGLNNLLTTVSVLKGFAAIHRRRSR